MKVRIEVDIFDDPVSCESILKKCDHLDKDAGKCLQFSTTLKKTGEWNSNMRKCDECRTVCARQLKVNQFGKDLEE